MNAETMVVKNNEIGKLTKKVADKNARNARLNAQLKKTSHRSITNAFERAYFKRTARAFELWKIWSQNDSHAQRIIKRTLAHWKSWNARFIMNVM